MNKADLYKHVALNADLSKSSAIDAVEGFLSGISVALQSGDSVQLVGFGTFSVAERAARTGRNPRTGEPVEIEARNVPKFKAGKALKDAVK